MHNGDRGPIVCRKVLFLVRINVFSSGSDFLKGPQGRITLCSPFKSRSETPISEPNSLSHSGDPPSLGFRFCCTHRIPEPSHRHPRDGLSPGSSIRQYGPDLTPLHIPPGSSTSERVGRPESLTELSHLRPNGGPLIGWSRSPSMPLEGIRSMSSEFNIPWRLWRPSSRRQFRKSDRRQLFALSLTLSPLGTNGGSYSEWLRRL